VPSVPPCSSMVCIYCDAIAYWIDCPQGRVKRSPFSNGGPHPLTPVAGMCTTGQWHAFLFSMCYSLRWVPWLRLSILPPYQQATLPQQHGDDARSQCSTSSFEYGRS
jgi:hypothetical protein